MIRKCYEQLYNNKFNNSKKQKFLKWTQEEIDTLALKINYQKTFPQNHLLQAQTFHRYQAFKKEILPMSNKIFQKIEYQIDEIWPLILCYCPYQEIRCFFSLYKSRLDFLTFFDIYIMTEMTLYQFQIQSLRGLVTSSFILGSQSPCWKSSQLPIFLPKFLTHKIMTIRNHYCFQPLGFGMVHDTTIDN